MTVICPRCEEAVSVSSGRTSVDLGTCSSCSTTWIVRDEPVEGGTA